MGYIFPNASTRNIHLPQEMHSFRFPAGSAQPPLCYMTNYGWREGEPPQQIGDKGLTHAGAGAAGGGCWWVGVIAMANSRGRRKLRRMLQEAGLGSLLKPPSSVPIAGSTRFFKRIPRWVYACAAVFAIAVTLLQAYPWLSLQQSGFLDASNPYSEMFDLVNDGFIPIANLDAVCTNQDAQLGAVHYGNNSLMVTHFADYLWHDGRVTAPCFHLFEVTGARFKSGAKFKIEIIYAFWLFDYPRLRRSQSFYFESVAGPDGAHHWIRK